MEERISGFRKQGTWVSIVEHGEQITEALREEHVEGPEFDEWDEWRPKAEERLSEDVTEKAAEQASPTEGEGEKAGKSPIEDVGAAGDELKDAISEIAEGDLTDAFEEGQDSVERVSRAVDTAGRKLFRTIEEPVYKHVMTQLSPVYFDNSLISANVDRTRDAENRYIFEVNVNNDDLKKRVRDHLEEYEKLKRWHGETEKETSSVEATEGTESIE